MRRQAAGRASLDRDELDLEDKRGLRRDGALARVAVGDVARNRQLRFPTCAVAENSNSERAAVQTGVGTAAGNCARHGAKAASCTLTAKTLLGAVAGREG